MNSLDAQNPFSGPNVQLESVDAIMLSIVQIIVQISLQCQLCMCAILQKMGYEELCPPTQKATRKTGVIRSAQHFTCQWNAALAAFCLCAEGEKLTMQKPQAIPDDQCCGHLECLLMSCCMS